MNIHAKALLQYLLLYPLYNVIGIAAGSAFLYFLLGWSVSYGMAFFKVASIALVIIFYFLNIRILFEAIVGLLKRKR